MRRRLHVVAVILAFIITYDVRFTLALKAQYKEPHVYEFSSEISTGVEKPAQFTSKLAINGLLKIQRKSDDPEWKNVYFISLENLKHSSYYGPVTSNTVGKNKFEPIPNDSKDLEKPFLAIYDEYGKIQGLKIQNGEKSWTRNIKKSIASMLQFDWSKTLNLIRESTGNNEYTDESTVHGKCSVLYNATRQNDETGEIEKRAKLIKTYNPDECNNSILDVEGYEVQYNDPIKIIKDQMNSSVNTILEFDIGNDGPIIKKIVSHEKYLWALDGLGDINYNSNIFEHSEPKLVKISHVLTFNNIDKSSNFNKLDETMFSEVHSQLFFENEEMIEDYSESSVKKTIGKIKNLFIEAVEYSKTNRLKEVKPGEESRQVFNKIQSAMSHLNTEQLELLYEETVGEDKPGKNLIGDIMVQMLPFVGTKASFVFTKNLIMTGKIIDDMAVRVLYPMPAYVRQPTKELLLEMRSLIQKNNGLSEEVFTKAVLSFSHLLRRVSESQKGSDTLMKENLEYFSSSLKDAECIGMKLAYLTAMANTRSHDAVEYMLPLLKKNEDPSMDRLRYGVIRLLSTLINEDDDLVFESLQRILLDESEPRPIRLAAYDVLFARDEIDEDDARDINRAMDREEHLQNYHQSTLQSLKQLDMLPESWKPYAKESFTTSKLLSRNAILKVNNEASKKLLGLVSSNLRYGNIVKLSFVIHESSIFTSYDVMDISSGRLVQLEGGYINLIQLGNTESKNEHVIDLWVKIADRISFEDIKISSIDNLSPLDVLIELKKIISRLVVFTYRRFTSFSMPTGFGIPVVFQHKIPTFFSCISDIKTKMDGTKFAMGLNTSIDLSEHAYSDSLFFNPFTKSKHSIKKYDQIEMHVPFSLSVTYDFFNKHVKVELPIILKNQNSDRGIASYTSSGVMITQDDNETQTDSCPFCGFQSVKSNDSNRYFNANHNISDEYNTVGLRVSKSIYNCQLTKSSIPGFFQGSLFGYNPVKSLEIDQCGSIQLVGPDTLGSVSQIELMLRADAHSSEFKEMPWYFLPKTELHFKTGLAFKKRFDNSIDKVGLFNLDFVSDQGHFTNKLNLTLSSKTNGSDYLNVCYNMHQNYPLVSDTRLPSLDDTRNLKINSVHRVTYGYSPNNFCSDNMASIKLKHTAQMTSKQVEELEQRALDSDCAKQKSNPHIVYPLGSSPLTIDCIKEFINNSTLRNQIFDLTYDETPIYPIRLSMALINSYVEKMKADYPEMDIKIISLQNREVEGNMVYEMSFPMDMKTKLLGKTCTENTFFSLNFLKKIKTGEISVTNIFPKLMILSDGISKPLQGIDNWKRIRTNKEDCKILIKSTESDKLSLKIVCGNDELRFEPTRMAKNTKKELSEDVLFESAVYFNNNLVDYSPKRVFLPLRKANGEDNHIFSLLKVGPYIMGRPMKMSLSVYYSINSVTVIEEN